jgi:hypothetical protein
MNYGRHRLDDGCSRNFGKVWTWLLINRASLNPPGLELTESASKAPSPGFDEDAQRQAGWREALGGWRRQTLIRQICDLFYHPLNGDETITAHPQEGSAVPPVLWNELQPRRADALAGKPQDLRLEDLLPESALRRIALPRAERISGQPSILAKAA